MGVRPQRAKCSPIARKCMAKNRKLLVIGASPFQVPLILKARELGYTVSATSYLKDDPGLLVADKGFNVSILDFGGLERLCQREGICAVATGASDLGTLAVGHLNDTLGLAGITEDQARSVSDKGRFVLLQKDLGLGLGESFIVTDGGDLEAALAKISAYPVILKPLYASGSRGVRVVRSAEEARGYHSAVCDASSLEKGYVLQTYLDGVEHGCECLVEGGEVAFLQLTHKFRNEHNVPLGHCVPVEGRDRVLRSLTEQIEKIVGRLGVTNSAINIDVIVTPDGGAAIIDFSFRLGGNLLPQLMRQKYGVDTVERVIRYCFPEDIDSPPVVAQTPGCCGAVIFGSPQPGVLSEEMQARITRLFEDSARVIDLVFDIAPGETFENFDQGSHRFGHALFEVDSLESYSDILNAHLAIVRDELAREKP